MNNLRLAEERGCQTERTQPHISNSRPARVPQLLIPRRIISLKEPNQKVYTEPSGQDHVRSSAIPSSERSQERQRVSNGAVNQQEALYSVECNRIDTDAPPLTINSSPKRLTMTRSSLCLPLMRLRAPYQVRLRDSERSHTNRALKQEGMLSHRASQKGKMCDRSISLRRLTGYHFYAGKQIPPASSVLLEYEQFQEDIVQPYLHARRTICLVPKKLPAEQCKALQQRNALNTEKVNAAAIHRQIIKLSPAKPCHYLTKSRQTQRLLEMSRNQPRKGICVTSRSPDRSSELCNRSTRWSKNRIDIPTKQQKIVVQLKARTSTKTSARNPTTPIAMSGCCQ